MFTISKKQLDVFTKVTRINFEKKAAEHLRVAFANTTQQFTDNDLTELIKFGIDEAAHYGIVDRREVLTYLEYVHCLGLDFARKSKDPWILRTLKISNISGVEKMNRLEKILPLKPTFS